MSPWRPAIVATVVTCVGLLTACRSGDESEQPNPPVAARPTATA